MYVHSYFYSCMHVLTQDIAENQHLFADVILLLKYLLYNQVLRKTKIVVEILSRKERKYDENMRSLTILESTQSTLIN